MNEFADKLMKEFDEIAEKSATGQMTAIPIAHIKEIIKRVADKAINDGTVLPICNDCDLYECVTDNYCQYAGKCVPVQKCRYFVSKEAHNDR